MLNGLVQRAFIIKNVLAKNVFFCYTLANECNCNRRMLWKRMY